MKTVTLTERWGGHAAGTVLEILGPGDALAPRRIDPLRAEALVAHGLATDAPPPAAEPAPKPKKKKPSPVEEG